MDVTFNCDEVPGDTMQVSSNEQGHIWFEISADQSDIPSIRLTSVAARKLAHLILAEIGDTP